MSAQGVGTDPVEGQYNKETAMPPPTNGHHVTQDPANGMGSGQQFQQYPQYNYVPFGNAQIPNTQGKPHQAMVSQVYQPTLGKIGNPGPLGLIGFGVTTFILGLYQCGAG